MLNERDDLVEMVSKMHDTQRLILARLDAMPSEERLGNLRSEILHAMELAEKRQKDREDAERERADERRHADRTKTQNAIAATVAAENEKADKEFPRRLKDNLPKGLADLADQRREAARRRLVQYTPWIALTIMILGYVAQCAGVVPQGMGDLGNGIAKIR